MSNDNNEDALGDEDTDNMSMLEEMGIDFEALKNNTTSVILLRKVATEDTKNLVIYIPLIVYMLLNFTLILVPPIYPILTILATKICARAHLQNRGLRCHRVIFLY